MPALLSNTTDLQDVIEYRLIYPQKIQVPLHEDDLLYESKKNYSSAFNLGESCFNLLTFIYKYIITQHNIK